jgi:hypothetical protein
MTVAELIAAVSANEVRENLRKSSPEPRPEAAEWKRRNPANETAAI